MSTYLELAALTTNSDFLARIGYAAAKYAAYIQNEAADVQNHLARKNWQIRTQANIQQMAIAMATTIVQDANVTTNLAAVSDADLQTATETAANAMIGTTISYTDLATLATDQGFLRRAQMAVVKFANYILNEDPASVNHAARYAWARNAIMNTLTIATSLAPAIVMGETVAAALLATTDAQLQSAVEFEIGQLLL